MANDKNLVPSIAERWGGIFPMKSIHVDVKKVFLNVISSVVTAAKNKYVFIRLSLCFLFSVNVGDGQP